MKINSDGCTLGSWRQLGSGIGKNDIFVFHFTLAKTREPLKDVQGDSREVAQRFWDGQRFSSSCLI